VRGVRDRRGLERLAGSVCFGADFKAIATTHEHDVSAGPLYDLWLRPGNRSVRDDLACARLKRMPEALGFVAASDIVLADETAQFSLSELLFGLYPACVLPFLIRRTGFQKAHYLT